LPAPLRRSKLEVCLDILGALAKRPMGLTRLSLEVNVNYASLKKYLDFLVEQGLVKEEAEGVRRSYYVTERGLTALGYFMKLKSMIEVERIVVREA